MGILSRLITSDLFQHQRIVETVFPGVGRLELLVHLVLTIRDCPGVCMALAGMVAAGETTLAYLAGRIPNMGTIFSQLLWVEPPCPPLIMADALINCANFSLGWYAVERQRQLDAVLREIMGRTEWCRAFWRRLVEETPAKELHDRAMKCFRVAMDAGKRPVFPDGLVTFFAKELVVADWALSHCTGTKKAIAVEMEGRRVTRSVGRFMSKMIF